jgi:membrane associated rhomboid family serine protease
VSHRVLRSAPDARAVEEWGLVLAAAGIAHRLERAAGEWSLVVADWDAERARAALEAYEAEHAAADAASDLPEYGRTHVGLWLAALLGVFHALAGPAWFEAGRASARRIAAGEAWRTVTALSLHLDLAHLAGNVAACALFAGALGRALGPGVTAALLLAAGAGGNALNALLRGGPHAAVGASTAIFGGIGILGGLAAAHRHRARVVGRRAWLPLAGGLALLALLGTGERADLGAHLLGLLVGSGLGIVTALGLRRPPGRVAQATFAIAAGAVFAACWLAALR